MWTALLLLAASPVFLVGTDVNLRARPSTKAKIVVTRPIGERCERLGEKRGWVELRCGAHRGFTKAALTSTTKPTAAAMDAAAAKASSAKERLTLRMRAAVLEESAPRLDALRAAWLDAEHAILARSRKVDGRAKCEAAGRACIEASLRPLLGSEWLIDLRGADFVLASLSGPAMSVVLGRLVDGELRVHLANAYEPEPALVKALRRGAEPKPRGAPGMDPAPRVAEGAARAWAKDEGGRGWADPEAWQSCPPDGEPPYWRFEPWGLFVKATEVRYGDDQDLQALVDLRVRKGKPRLGDAELAPRDTLRDPCDEAADACARHRTRRACESGDPTCAWADGSCEFSAP